MNAQNKTDGKPYVIAHRGASGYAPENTLASFKKALEIGEDMVELDVHLSKDQKLVVIHDETIDRTTDMSGAVRDMAWDELKKADAGSWFGPQFKGERLPLLQDVLRTVNGQCKVLIEIKDGGKYYPGIEEKVWEAIKEYHAESWCLIQSFSQYAVEHFSSLKTGLPVYKLVVGNIPVLPICIDHKLRWGSVLKYRQFAGINPYRKFFRKRFVRKLHKRGQEIFVWVINKEDDMKKLIAAGVDGIITNYPDRLKKLLGRE